MSETIRVRAMQHGQYKGVMYQPGDVFEIEDTTYPVHQYDEQGNPVKDAKGQPVVIENKPHLEFWMKKIEAKKTDVDEDTEKPKAKKGRTS